MGLSDPYGSGEMAAGEEGLKRIFQGVMRVWIAMLLLCSAVAALDPDRQISQYAHTAWRVQDGAFRGTPHAIAQTADGYLWIGTESGLVRFDGVKFELWTPPKGQALPSNRVYSLLGGRDGSLWIGTGAGLARLKDGRIENFAPSAPGFIESIVEDPGGTIWITRSQVGSDRQGPLCNVSGDHMECHGESEGIPFPYAQPLARDQAGNFWIGSSDGLCRWRPESVSTYFPAGLKRTKGLAGVSALAPNPDGSLWVGMRPVGAGVGLERLVEGKWRNVEISGFEGSRVPVASLRMDRNGSLWIGTDNRGIYRLHDGTADHFGSEDGLSSDSATGFFEDREGNLWIVTTRGIDRFHDMPIESFSRREGLIGEEAGSVVTSTDGTVWIGNLGGLDVLRHDRLSAITSQNGLPGRLITSMFESPAGKLWVGLDGGLTVYDQGRFQPIRKSDGSPLGVITSIIEDTEKNIWAESTHPALYRIQGSQVVEEIDPPKVGRSSTLAMDPKGGIWLALNNGELAHYYRGNLQSFSPNSGRLRNLFVDADGSVWAASEQGLVRWSQGRMAVLSTRNHLPCDAIFAVIRDNQNDLWLDSECGFVQISDAELRKWWEQPDQPVRVNTLDAFDGAQPAITNFRPELSKSPDGKLWFVNDDILQMVDPGHLVRNKLPPPVHIQQIVADQRRYPLTDDLRLPALIRNLEIDYTALSFVVPQKVRFRYKLEGHDTEWQDAGTRRQATYTDLRPGHYRFHVIACNNDGVWNDVGASAGFAILPAFFQTWWFWTICLVTGIGLLWLLYARRVRQLSVQMQTRLEERLEEREAIARDLHDTLLQGFFSAAMQLDVANDQIPASSPAKPIVQRVIELMNQIGEEGRSTIRSLRSPLRGSTDLEQALWQVREEFPAAGNVDFTVVVDGLPRLLNPIVWDDVYRLGREAITNAFRHSGANKIEVELEYTSRNMRLSVRDDGCGMDAHVVQSGREGHWGLSGMRERAEKIDAKLTVLSRPNAGTEVVLLIPGRVAFETSTSTGWPKWLSAMFRRNQTNKSSGTSEDQ